jgi:hypothetical protein
MKKYYLTMRNIGEFCKKVERRGGGGMEKRGIKLVNLKAN